MFLISCTVANRSVFSLFSFLLLLFCLGTRPLREIFLLAAFFCFCFFARLILLRFLVSRLLMRYAIIWCTSIGVCCFYNHDPVVMHRVERLYPYLSMLLFYPPKTLVAVHCLSILAGFSWWPESISFSFFSESLWFCLCRAGCAVVVFPSWGAFSYASFYFSPDAV